jgi:hypothetical protein
MDFLTYYIFFFFGEVPKTVKLYGRINIILFFKSVYHYHLKCTEIRGNLVYMGHLVCFLIIDSTRLHGFVHTSSLKV